MSKISDRSHYDSFEELGDRPEQWVDIQAIGRCVLTEQVRGAIRALLINYVNDRYREEESPSFENIGELLEEMETVSASFARVLDAIKNLQGTQPSGMLLREH